MQASITLGTCHFILMLRSLLYDCSGLYGAAWTHSAYFGMHVLPTLLLIINRCAEWTQFCAQEWR